MIAATPATDRSDQLRTRVLTSPRSARLRRVQPRPAGPRRDHGRARCRRPQRPAPADLSRSLLAPVLLLVAACGPVTAPAGPVPPAEEGSSADAPAVRSAAGSGGRAVRIDDYYRFPRILSPQMSPNGQWVVFTVAVPLDASNTDRVETWAVRTDGKSKAQRILHGGIDVVDPAWRNDGLLVYHVNGVRFAVDLSHRNAEPLHQQNLVRGVLSPDGQWIATAARLTVRGAAPSYPSAFERRHEERFRGQIFDWLNYKRDGAAVPVPDPRDAVTSPGAEIFLIPVHGGEGVQLTSLGLRPTGLNWTPDGQAVVFTADDGYRDETTYTRADILVASLDGTVQRLTRDAFLYSQLAFSPDGRHLAFTRTFGLDTIVQHQLDHAGPRDILVMRWPSGEYLNVTFDFELDPGPPIWSGDSRSIYFLAEIGGARHLFRVAITGGPAEQVTTGPRRIDDVTFDTAFSRMAYTVTSHDRPPEIYVANVDGSAERQLTRVYDELLADIAVSQAERIRFDASDGTPLEGWLVFPRGYTPDGGPYPLIIENHGGPHIAIGYDFDFRQQLLAADGYFVLEVNFRGSTGYGEEFKFATWGEWGTKDGADVVAALDYVLEHFPVDGRRIGVSGHSYGGFLTNWLITQYPTRFAAAVSIAGISNWISDYGLADISFTKETEFYGPPWDPRAREIMIRQSPLFYADRVRTPTLFIHGERDFRVPLAEAEQFYFALRKNNVPARIIVYADMPHTFDGHWNEVHWLIHEMRWWRTYLTEPFVDGKG